MSLFYSITNVLRETVFEIIYTDASVLSNHSGFAIHHLGTNTTVARYMYRKDSLMTPELRAIELAFDFVLEKGYGKVTILTDSTSAVIALNDKDHDNRPHGHSGQ